MQVRSSTCPNTLIAAGIETQKRSKSSKKKNSSDDEESSENQESENDHEIPVDIQSTTALSSTNERDLMNDNNLGAPTECINISYFPDQNTYNSGYDQNYANPNDLMNLHSTSMPSPVPAPVLLPTPISFAPEPNRPDIPAFNPNYIPTSFPLANSGTVIYPSNNNYANDVPLFPYSNDKNELNDDQASIISIPDSQKYYETYNQSPANSSHSLHPISQDERKIVDNNSAELFNEK